MTPSNQLIETRIFHITHVDNLGSILSAGSLFPKNAIVAGSMHTIANEDVQKKRSATLLPLPPAGNLHDYVPFYFAQRSPMLYCNHRGSHEDASSQEEIIYLCSTAQEVERDHQYLFYDRHAILTHAQCFNKLSDLNKIEWSLLFEPPTLDGFSKFWQNKSDTAHPKWIYRMEVRQAEFLVYNQMDIDSITSIAVINNAMKERVEATLQEYGSELRVCIKPEWYY